MQRLPGLASSITSGGRGNTFLSKRPWVTKVCLESQPQLFQKKLSPNLSGYCSLLRMIDSN